MNETLEPNKITKNSPKTKMLISYIILFIILFFVGWGIWHLTHQSVTSAPGSTHGKSGKNGGARANGAATVVGVTQVLQQQVQQTVQALGTVTSTNTVVVHPLINGTLMQVYFKEGSLVQKGQLLALIDDRAPKAALLQAQGQLLKDQALLTNAKLDMQRYAQLWQQDSIAKQQYDTQVSLVKQYEGVVETDQAAVANAQLQLSYTRIVSPVDGRIGLRQVDVGNMVNTSDANGIANITQLKNISVVFAVPEQYLTQLMQIMDHPEQHVGVQAWDRQNTQKLADGQLVALDNQVNINTGTINIKASFDNQNQHLFPNQFVNVRMSLGNIPNAIIVPTVALQLGAKGSFVYKVNPDQTVSAVTVQTGAVVDDNTVITGGTLNAHDLVVTDGVDKLKDGAKISVANTVGQGKSIHSSTGAGHRHNPVAQETTAETSNNPERSKQWQHHSSGQENMAMTPPSAQTAQ